MPSVVSQATSLARAFFTNTEAKPNNLIDFLINHIATEQTTDVIDATLAAILDVGFLFSPLQSSILDDDDDEQRNKDKLSWPVETLVDALSSFFNNNSGEGDAGDSKESQAIVVILSRLLRSAIVVEGSTRPDKNNIAIFRHFFGPLDEGVAKHPWTGTVGRVGRGLGNETKTHLPIPTFAPNPYEKDAKVFALKIMKAFQNLFGGNNSSSSSSSSFSELASFLGSNPIHPGVVCETFFHAAFCFVESELNASASTGMLLESETKLMTYLFSSASSSSSSLLSPLAALRLLIGTQAAVDTSIAHAFSIMIGRIRDLVLACDFENLVRESEKAVFSVAFLYTISQKERNNTTLSSSADFFNLPKALDVLQLIFDTVNTKSSNAFVSANVHRAIAEATKLMEKHSSSAFAEPIIDKKHVPQEVPGEVEVVGRNYSLLRFSSARPSWSTDSVNHLQGNLEASASSKSSQFVGTIKTGASSSSSPVCAVNIAVFVNWLLKLGQLDAAHQLIEMGLDGKLSRFVTEESILGGAHQSEDAASTPPPVLGSAPSQNQNQQQKNENDEDATNNKNKSFLNLFLCPSIISSFGSVTDVVGTELLARLAGGVELERLCKKYYDCYSSSTQSSSSTSQEEIQDLLSEIEQRFQSLESVWKNECWPLMKLARSHLAGYPVAVHALILLRSIHASLQQFMLKVQEQQQQEQENDDSPMNNKQLQPLPNLSRTYNFWLNQTIAFYSQFLAPCMSILPPTPLLSGIAHEILELLARKDQRKIIEALPSLGQQLNSRDNHQLCYPAERIAFVRHNALLSYCVSRLTDKDVKEFAQVLAPVLHASPKIVIDKLLQRAIAYPAVELQLVNALLLRDAPPLVFTLLPVMASERVNTAIARDESTAEARSTAVATLVSLVWRHNWDAFASGHIFDSIEESLAQNSRKTLFFVLPFLKSIFSLMLLKFCESERTYNAQQLEALPGGSLLRWWNCGDAESMLQRWLPQLFTPLALCDLWRRFAGEKVLLSSSSSTSIPSSFSVKKSVSTSTSQTSLGVRLLWSLFQLQAATNSIYEDARGSPENNTLMSMVDQDTTQDLSRILIEGLRGGGFDPMRVVRYQANTPNFSENVNKILSLQTLAKTTPRCFALLNSNERVLARHRLFLLAADNNEEKDGEQNSSASSPALSSEEIKTLIFSIMLTPNNNSSDSSSNEDDAAATSSVKTDVLFGCEINTKNNTNSPRDSSIAKELEFYGLFWLLNLSDLAPIRSSSTTTKKSQQQQDAAAVSTTTTTTHPFDIQVADTKSRIQQFTKKAEAGEATSSSRRRKPEFDSRDILANLDREQQHIQKQHSAADKLFSQILKNCFVVDDCVTDISNFSFEEFSEKFVLTCMLPRAVSGTTIDALAVAAFVERLARGTTTDVDSNNIDEQTASEITFFKTLATNLASYFVRAFCSMMSTFSPAESKRGCIALGRLFWFFAENVSDESVLELSSFVTQSTFSILFDVEIPDFIQRTALSIIETLRNGPTTSSSGHKQQRTANWTFPITKTECKVLHPAVALHAKASSPLFASATKLYHFLKTRSAQLISSSSAATAATANAKSSSFNTNQQQQEVGKTEDDHALFAKATLGLSSLCAGDPTNVVQMVLQQAGKRVQRNATTSSAPNEANTMIDEAFESSVAVLLSTELQQIHEAHVKETGGVAGGAEEEEEEGGVEEDDDDENDDEKQQQKENGDDDDASSRSSSASISASDDDDDDEESSFSGSDESSYSDEDGDDKKEE